MTEENKKSLMKKTKSELIDIIARKDDTEERYSSTIKNLEKNVAELSDELARKLNVIKGHEEGDKEYAEEIKELKEDIFNCNNYIETIKSKINTLQDEKETLQVKCGEFESLYNESNIKLRTNRTLVYVLATSVAALVGVLMLLFV